MSLISARPAPGCCRWSYVWRHAVAMRSVNVYGVGLIGRTVVFGPNDQATAVLLAGCELDRQRESIAGALPGCALRADPCPQRQVRMRIPEDELSPFACRVNRRRLFAFPGQRLLQIGEVSAQLPGCVEPNAVARPIGEVERHDQLARRDAQLRPNVDAPLCDTRVFVPVPVARGVGAAALELCELGIDKDGREHVVPELSFAAQPRQCPVESEAERAEVSCLAEVVAGEPCRFVALETLVRHGNDPVPRAPTCWLNPRLHELS